MSTEDSMNQTVTNMFKRILLQSLVVIVAIATTLLITGEFDLSKFLISSITAILVVSLAVLILHIAKRKKRVDKTPQL